MDSTSIEDFLSDYENSALPEFVPGGYYSAAGDCLFFCKEDAPDYAKRVDSLLTLYRALDDGRVIGMKIKGASILVQEIAREVYDDVERHGKEVSLKDIQVCFTPRVDGDRVGFAVEVAYVLEKTFVAASGGGFPWQSRDSGSRLEAYGQAAVAVDRWAMQPVLAP